MLSAAVEVGAGVAPAPVLEVVVDPTETPGNSEFLHSCGSAATKAPTSSEGQPLTQAMRFGPALYDWQVQSANALPVSSPSQNETTGSVCSHCDTHEAASAAGRTSSSKEARDRMMLTMMPAD